MLLSAWLVAYRLRRDVSALTVEQYDFAIRGLAKWLQRPPALADLSDDLLNRWATDMLESGMARKTVRNRLGAIAALWRSAAAAGELETWPRHLKRIKVAPPLPEAWNIAQMEMLLAACDRVSGSFRSPICRLRRSTLLRAYVLTGWYSGLRMCDLLLLARDQIGADGSACITQHKTGWPILFKLPAECIAAIDATGAGERDRIFPLDRKQVYVYVRRLVREAGFRGTPKWLRRSSATDVDAQTEGAATKHLGHRDPRMAACYIDPRLLPYRRTMPRRIG